MRPKRTPPLLKDRIRFQHMLDAARQARTFVAGRSREDLETDAMLLRALLHAMLEIGEAAANVSDAGRARVAGIPWGQVVETRHILVHVYWGVNKDKVWASATEDLPFLIAAIEAAFKTWPLEP
jgi:uncharacterized protein with HEPN domain